MDDACMLMHRCMYIRVNICLIIHAGMCICIWVCWYVCMCVFVTMRMLSLSVIFICLLFFYFLSVCCLFHQSLFANCVLPTMYKGEAYISVSLLNPPFSSQSVTLWNIMQLIKIVFYLKLKYLLHQCMIIINDIWSILICLLCSHFVWK